MFKNIAAVVFVIVFLVELYYAAAGSAHRKKKKLKGWNPVKGTIESKEKLFDQLAHRNVIEMKIISESGNTVYAKQSPMFCIFDEGEEVELIEKDGVHRFIGNDRVHKRGVRETLIGTIPMLVLIVIAIILSVVANV
ncbi:MAG: hypothetical protein K5865_04455 [Eubacterium sp.]|nr:hypothetical protein [Eubacterium sp.]MCR4845972.1 hypothetical protein [Eubacterium sp.]